jgi:hypothetical protein
MILAPGPYLLTLPKEVMAVVLHNSNVLASIPLAHSTKLSELYETLKLVLEKIKYHEHEWQMCCWDNKEATQNFPVSYASGIPGPGTNTACIIFCLKNET